MYILQGTLALGSIIEVRQAKRIKDPWAEKYPNYSPLYLTSLLPILPGEQRILRNDLPWHSSTVLLETLPRPILNCRSHYLHLDTDQMYDLRDSRWQTLFKDATVSRAPLSRNLPMLCAYEPEQGQSEVATLAGRVVKKGEVEWYHQLSRFDLEEEAQKYERQRYGCLFNLTIADASRELNVSFWDSAVPLYYEHIQVNDIIRIDNVPVRRTAQFGTEGAVNVFRKTIFGNVPLDSLVAHLSQSDIELFLDSVSKYRGPTVDILRSHVQLASWTHEWIMDRFPYAPPECTDLQAFQRGDENLNCSINVCAKVLYVGNVIRFSDNVKKMSRAQARIECTRWANLDLERDEAVAERHDKLLLLLLSWHDYSLTWQRRMMTYRWILLQTSTGEPAALKLFNCTTIASSENAADAEDESETNYFDDISPGDCVFVSGLYRTELTYGANRMNMLGSTLQTRMQWWPDVESLLESDLTFLHPSVDRLDTTLVEARGGAFSIPQLLHYENQIPKAMKHLAQRLLMYESCFLHVDAVVLDYNAADWPLLTIQALNGEPYQRSRVAPPDQQSHHVEELYPVLADEVLHQSLHAKRPITVTLQDNVGNQFCLPMAPNSFYPLSAPASEEHFEQSLSSWYATALEDVFGASAQDWPDVFPYLFGSGPLSPSGAPVTRCVLQLYRAGRPYVELADGPMEESWRKGIQVRVLRIFSDGASEPVDIHG